MNIDFINDFSSILLENTAPSLWGFLTIQLSMVALALRFYTFPLFFKEEVALHTPTGITIYTVMFLLTGDAIWFIIGLFAIDVFNILERDDARMTTTG